MTSKAETVLQMIAPQKAWLRLLNAVFGFFCTLMGTSAFMVAIFITPPPVGNIVYAIMWIPIIVTIFLALLRNIILQFIFRKIPHSSFLSLVDFGKIVNYIIIASASLFFLIGAGIPSVALIGVAFGLVFYWVPMFLIFSDPLTHAAETRLLFELLVTNLDNFEKRQLYLRTISKKVENQLKIGNIKVPNNEFVYYFNMKLLQGTDIKNDLTNIESWIVDKKTPCFDSLKNIYPESKLEPWKRISLSRQLMENPALVKIILYLIALILIALSPTLQNYVLKLLTP